MVFTANIFNPALVLKYFCHSLIRCYFSDVTINNIDCDNTEDNLNEKGLSVKSNHKDSVSIKKEIIGILKPPNLKKDLKSFPSLPECFLHDLGLLDNFALR